MEFFVLPFQLGEMERYVLWFTGEIDGVLTDGDGHIAAFLSAKAATIFANDRKLQVAPESSALVDLRWIQENSLTPDNIDSVNALNAWNFFADVAASLPDKGAPFIAQDRRLNATYDKLFWGNNLPSVTPAGECYEPAWSGEEVVEMQALLRYG